MNEAEKVIRRIHQGITDKMHSKDNGTCWSAVLGHQLFITKDGKEAGLNYNDSNLNLFEKYMPDYVARCFADRLYKPEEFFSACSEICSEHKEDMYFSINSFDRCQKKTEHVRHLNAIAMDFDFYKIEEYSNLTPWQMYQEHIKDKLPFAPTFVIDSGRGLYVIYCFQHAPKKCTEVYKSVYKAIQKKFEKEGMDEKAMNVTQVIRIPGSINSKSKKPVTILEENETDYTLKQFIDEFLPYDQKEVKKYKRNHPEPKKKKKKRISSASKNKPRNPFRGLPPHSQISYAEEVLEDFKTLIHIRKWDKNAGSVGSREYMMFVILEKNIYDRNPIAMGLKRAHRLNDMLHTPLSDEEVEAQSMPPRGYLYTSSLKKIVRKLHITDEESKSMKVLKTERARKRQYKYRETHNLLTGRTNKQEEIFQRRKMLANLLKDNKISLQDCIQKVAKKFKCSVKTVKGDLKHIYADMHSFLCEMLGFENIPETCMERSKSLVIFGWKGLLNLRKKLSRNSWETVLQTA